MTSKFNDYKSLNRDLINFNIRVCYIRNETSEFDEFQQDYFRFFESGSGFPAICNVLVEQIFFSFGKNHLMQRWFQFECELKSLKFGCMCTF